jgi:hypothetical protein
MKKLTPSERQEVLQKLKEKFADYEVQDCGYCRYVICERYPKGVEGGTVLLQRVKMMVDEEGNIIPLGNNYDSIFMFSKSVAVVCQRGDVKIKENSFAQAVKYGLIDVNGKELLPCIYDNISDHLDGFVELSKGGEGKFTQLHEIIDGTYTWEEASPWH